MVARKIITETHPSISSGTGKPEAGKKVPSQNIHTTRVGWKKHLAFILIKIFISG
jgi:hypothetical protein